MSLSPESQSAREARWAAEREQAQAQWLLQPNWPSAAAAQLMASILANDAQEIAAWIGQVDVTVPPPAFKKRRGDEFRVHDVLAQPKGTPWLSYAVHAKASAAIGPLIQAGADPLQPEPTEDGSSALFHAFNALGDSADALRAAFYAAMPTLNAAFPVDAQGYSPLAMVLCRTSPKAIVEADGSDHPTYGAVAQVMREVMARGGNVAWTDATREAVFHGAVTCGRPALLPILAQVGLFLGDVPKAGQQALLLDALNLHRIYAGDLRRDAPTEGGDRQWLAYFAQQGIDPPIQALAQLQDPGFEAAVTAYAQLRAGASPMPPVAAPPRRSRGPGR